MCCAVCFAATFSCVVQVSQLLLLLLLLPLLTG
jgi:hypothetical protein